MRRVLFFLVMSALMLWVPAEPALAQPAGENPPTAEDLGTVVPLEFGVLFIPDAFDPRDAGGLDLLVHFHVGLDFLAREVVASGLNAVMIHISPGGFSSAYRVPFEDDRELFGRLLSEALSHVRARSDVADDADWRRVNVSSFSAGYGAVRELLKDEGYVARIDGLALCDTVYAGYVEQGGENVPSPTQVAPFIAFARLAADEESGKTMVMTHSYLEPGSYAGTHEVAQALIDAVGADDRAIDEEGPAGMHLLRRATLGRLTVIGVEGVDGPAHMKHLHTIRHWLVMLAWGAEDEGAQGRRGRGAE